ncbi:MAG TPA: nuclear transport factor 2 family protein, partial [Burkholderiales bacterium]|nr:nuclear transport factor 2 family protein [Burkholderiales bacterium]
GTTASQMTDPQRLARLEYLLDRQDILDCLNRVCRGIDRFDQDLFLSAFHSDAIIDVGEMVGAPAEVYHNGAELHEHGQSSTLHYLPNHSCEIDGDLAHAETYLLYTGRNRDETNWIAGGRYIDRLERRDGTWKIAFRYVVIEWSSMIPGGVVPLFEHIADVHLNGVPSRSKDDPSYRRPLTNRRERRSLADPREFSVPRR